LRAAARADRAGYQAKPGRRYRWANGGLAIDKYQVFVGLIDEFERMQEAGQIDFRATDSARHKK
jgi:hypothetical protein